MPYKIIRFFQNANNRTIDTGLTLEEAQAHCSNPEASSSTCTTSAGRRRTKSKGAWFEGYTES